MEIVSLFAAAAAAAAAMEEAMAVALAVMSAREYWDQNHHPLTSP